MSGFSHAEADRRIANMVQVGRIVGVDAATSRVRVAFGDTLETHWIPATQPRMGGLRIHGMPTEGEQVVVAAPGGDLARAVVLGSVAAGNAPDDRASDALIIDGGGGTIIIRAENIKLVGEVLFEGNVEIDGDLKINGSVLATGQIGSETKVVAPLILETSP